MSFLKDEIEYKGMSIKIYYDEDAESPADWDNPNAFLCADYRDLHVNSESLSASDCRDAIESGKHFASGFHIFPVCILDHSGLSLSLGEHHGWDYSNGWAFVCVKRTKGWSWEKSKAEKIAKSVVDEWNQYLSGEVYGFIARDVRNEIIDSCWGFYGEEGAKEAISQAKDAIDCRIRNLLRQHLAIRKAQIRHHVPLYAREAFSGC